MRAGGGQAGLSPSTKVRGLEGWASPGPSIKVWGLGDWLAQGLSIKVRDWGPVTLGWLTHPLWQTGLALLAQHRKNSMLGNAQKLNLCLMLTQARISPATRKDHVQSN